MLTVAKFGGSSLADSTRFFQAAELIKQNPSRKVIVVSAAGKRFDSDTKITDLLYAAHSRCARGGDAGVLFEYVRQRYLQIRDGCGLRVDLEPVFRDMELRLHESAAYAASRGEYLSALLMAALLGFRFLDSAQWMFFDESGRVREAESRAALRQLAGNDAVVLPGFYGTGHDGKIRTFSRGGSDVTGAWAAAWLDADLYENWTDVAGVFSEDPAHNPHAKPMTQMTYDQLQAMTQTGLQVFHADAVAPVQAARIPIWVGCTHDPTLPGTWIKLEKANGCPIKQHHWDKKSVDVTIDM